MGDLAGRPQGPDAVRAQGPEAVTMWILVLTNPPERIRPYRWLTGLNLMPSPRASSARKAGLSILR